jgi:hypothetical protein
MKTIKRAFYIYSEASLAVFLFFCAGMELLASFATTDAFIAWLALHAAAAFAVVGLLMALYVVRAVRRDRV